MNIQSLSVCVPHAGECLNRCAFCVSRMHGGSYDNKVFSNDADSFLYEQEFIERLEFARDNGCNTVMLTGSCEPQQNRSFLRLFGTLNRNLSRPFRWIEMQTTGVTLDEDYLLFLRSQVRVKTISLSLSSFDSDQNADYNGTPQGLRVDLDRLAHMAKKLDFVLRLSVNLTDAFDALAPGDYFATGRGRFGADQITFRVLYEGDSVCPQNEWIREHRLPPGAVASIREHILENGRNPRRLPFGMMRFNVGGLSTVLDDDCMAKADTEDYKYLVLREDCHLYDQWDDPASILF